MGGEKTVCDGDLKNNECRRRFRDPDWTPILSPIAPSNNRKSSGWSKFTT